MKFRGTGFVVFEASDLAADAFFYRVVDPPQGNFVCRQSEIRNPDGQVVLLHSRTKCACGCERRPTE